MRTWLLFVLLACSLSLAPAHSTPRHKAVPHPTAGRVRRPRAHVPPPKRTSGEPGEMAPHFQPDVVCQTHARLYRDTALLTQPLKPFPTARVRGSRDMLADRVLQRARRQLGTPYVWGGTSLKGADCSGFTMRIFKLFGISILRTADCQYYQGKPVSAPAPGDLVFFSTYLPGPSHVGIYLGNDRFIHASSRQKKVVISSLREKFFHDHYIGARRFF